MGAKEKMKIKELLESYEMLDILGDDAKDLASGDREYIGVIKLSQDFEQRLPRVIARYERAYNKLWNSFDDPEYSDEEQWVDARYELSMNFLMKNGLATRIK